VYTEQDRQAIRQKIKKYWIIAAAAEIVIIAVWVLSMKYRIEPLAYVSGIGIFAFFCALWCMLLGPAMRYNGFLKDMQEGESRVLEGSIAKIDEEIELQDGVRVHAVHMVLKESQDERIVYLNVSKREMMPVEGVEVKLNCFGRHIKEVTAF